MGKSKSRAIAQAQPKAQPQSKAVGTPEQKTKIAEQERELARIKGEIENYANQSKSCESTLPGIPAKIS